MASATTEKVHDSVIDFAKKITDGDIKDTYQMVVSTISVLKEIIINAEWKTAQELMGVISWNGKYLTRAAPLELSIGNMVYRILHIIREEYSVEIENKTEEADAQESLHKILTSEADKSIDFNKSVPSLKEALIDHINEFEVELETCAETITQQAPEHIHSNEIIMTLGRSKLVEDFFKKAAKTRTFDVIVAEGAPFLDGHEMADNLSKANIKTTLIPDSSIFALMSRVNKVIIGTHTVMADGGLRALTGSHAMAHAAKYYSVPVMVLLPLYKLSPLFHAQNAFNKTISPLEGVIKGNNSALLELCEAYNPVFDYVPADLVTLFISNTGGNAPSYMYRLISELYSQEDYDLEL